MADEERSFLASEAARAAAFLLPLSLSLRSLVVGFVTDDHAFRAELHAGPPNAPPAYDLFRFATGDPSLHERAVEAGRAAWWSAPDLKLHFLRPLAGLSFALDVRLFGEHAMAYHAVSLLWFLALLVAADAVFRSLAPAKTATLATLVFGLSHANAAAYAWLAARHALLGATFGAAAFALRLRADDDSRSPSSRLGLTLAALLALLLGFASSETALAGAALWIAWDLASRATWRDRLRGATPALVVSLVYLLAYRALGGGASGSGGYHDPFASPWSFAKVASVRVPALFADALLAVPVETAMIWPPPVSIALGVVAVALFASCLAVTWRDLSLRLRTALFAASLAALPTTLLGSTGFPSGRVLVLPNVAFSLVVAAAIVASFSSLGGRRGASFARVVASLACLVHLVLAPLSTYRDVRKLEARGRASERIADFVDEQAGEHRRVVLLTASDPYVFLYPRAVLADRDAPAHRCWSVLSAARSSHEIRRLDASTLEIEALDRPLLDGSFDALFRSPDRPFSVGETLHACGLSIRVAAVERGLPTKLDVDFGYRLERLAGTLFVFREHELVPFEPPAIGASVRVPWSSGPAGVL